MEQTMTMTWPTIQKHLRGRYKLADDTPDMISMIWSYDDGRKQKLIVRRYKAAEREMLEFKSPFARRGDVDPTTMLEDNGKLPLATIALSGDIYLVVYNALLAHLDLGDFDFILSRVAAVADTLEEKYVTRDEF
jgi:hypothetical protein